MSTKGHERGTRKQRKPTKPFWAVEEEIRIQEVERVWEEREAITAVLQQIPRHMRDDEEE